MHTIHVITAMLGLTEVDIYNDMKALGEIGLCGIKGKVLDLTLLQDS